MSLNMKLSEQLFLIEILVHKVHLRKDMYCQKGCKCPKAAFRVLGEGENNYSGASDADGDSNDYLPLRVRVKFINFPCVEINQKEFAGSEAAEPKNAEEKQKRKRDPGHFGTGKSFLFPMSPYDLIRGLNHYPLAVAVTFSDSEEDQSKVSVVGVTQVSLALEEVCNTVRRVNECEQILPISSTVKDAYDLVNMEGEYVGYIVMLIRLSCFGQSIVTQFQLTEERSYLFRNTRPDEPFPCDKCDDHLQYDPATYDLLPAAPLTSSDADLMELPCCEAARGGVFMERKYIQWRKIDCDCEEVPLEMDTGFLSRLSETYAEVMSNKLPCSCCGRNPLSRPDPRLPLPDEIPAPVENVPPLVWDKMMPLAGPPGTVGPSPPKTSAPVGTVLPLGNVPVGEATPSGLSPRAAAVAKIGYVRTPGYTASEYMTPVGAVQPKVQPAPGAAPSPQPCILPPKGQGLPVGYVPFNPESMPKPAAPPSPAPYQGEMFGAWSGINPPTGTYAPCNHPPCWEVMRLQGGAGAGEQRGSADAGAKKGAPPPRTSRVTIRAKSAEAPGARRESKKGAKGSPRDRSADAAPRLSASPVGRSERRPSAERPGGRRSTTDAATRSSRNTSRSATPLRGSRGKNALGETASDGGGERPSASRRGVEAERRSLRSGKAGPVAGPGIVGDALGWAAEDKKRKLEENMWQEERRYPRKKERDHRDMRPRLPNVKPSDEDDWIPDPPQRFLGSPTTATTTTGTRTITVGYVRTDGAGGGAGAGAGAGTGGTHDPWAPGGPWGPDGPWGARGGGFPRGRRARNPPIRYDTTGRLSGAFEREYEKEPPVRRLVRPRTVKGTLRRKRLHDMPPIRYDTTSCLTEAYKPPHHAKKLPSDIAVAVAAIKKGRKVSLKELQRMLDRLKHVDPPFLVTAFRPSYKYSYAFGSRYPGTVFGHRDCTPRARRVPAIQGWRWDTRAPIHRLKQRLPPAVEGAPPEGTWRPGAICNSLRDRVKAPQRATRPFGQGVKARRLSQEHLPLNEEGKSGKTDDEDNFDPKPTLHIHRYQGDYFVSMHPDDMAGENVPLQFRIINKEKKPVTCQDSDSELEIELFQPGAFYTPPKHEQVDMKTQCEEQFLVENYQPPLKIITATEIPKPIKPDADKPKAGKGGKKKGGKKGGKKGKKKK